MDSLIDGIITLLLVFIILMFTALMLWLLDATMEPAPDERPVQPRSDPPVRHDGQRDLALALGLEL